MILDKKIKNTKSTKNINNMKKDIKSRNHVSFILILFVILLSCASISAIAVNIVSTNSNVMLDSLQYHISSSEEIFTNQNNTIDNTTIIETALNDYEYNCTMKITANGSEYTYIIFDAANSSVDIAQNLGFNLSDGAYYASVECWQNITVNTTVITLEILNITNDINISDFNVSNDTINSTNDTNTTNNTQSNSSENMTIQIVEHVESSIATILLYSNDSKNIKVDSAPPIITINHPKDEVINISENINQTTILFDYSYEDESSTDCLINSVTGENFTIFGNQTNGYFANLGSGNYTYEIICTDELNNSAQLDASFIIQKILFDNSSMPIFGLTMDKQTYSIGENALMRIDANNESNVSITICPIANGWVQCYLIPELTNEIFPKIQTMPYTNKSGNYIVDGLMKYHGSTYHANTSYTIDNSLKSQIKASKTSVSKNELVTFNTSASGGIGPYSYLWVMHDGTTYSGIASYFNYTLPGSFTEYLLVNDSSGNKYNTSIKVLVKDKFKLTLYTVDKKTNARIANANVDLNENNYTTDANGQLTLELAEKIYDISANKDNYFGSIDNVDLSQNITISINMSINDINPPTINLLTQNASIFEQSSVKLKFKATDITPMYCALYTADSSSGWYTLKDYGDGLLSETEYTFEITDLSVGNYRWKIECLDANNNTAISESLDFVVSEQGVTNTLQSSDKDSYDINTILDGIDALSGDEAELADLLGIKDSFKELLDKLNNVDRDMHNIAFRRDLDETGKKELQENITSSIEDLKYNTPTELKVTNSKTFVKYVKDDDLGRVLSDYYLSRSLNVNQKQFFTYTKTVQSRAIINTKVMNIQLSYLDGKTKDITVVRRAINPSKGQSIDLTSIVESIPKTINMKEINILDSDFELLKGGSLIEYPPSVKEINYYINRSINPEDFQLSDTVIIDRNMKVVAATGFSIAGVDSIQNITSDGKSIMIILIIILIIIYVTINFNLIEKVRILLGSDNKKITYMRVLINDAIDNMNADDYNKAAFIYREVKLNYEGASSIVRKQLFEECFDLCNKMDVRYFTDLNTETIDFIKSNRFEDSMKNYDRMKRTYDKIDDKYRTGMYDMLVSVYNAASAIGK